MCVHACVSVHACAYACACISVVCVHGPVCVLLSVQKCVCVCAYTQTHVCVQVCIAEVCSRGSFSQVVLVVMIWIALQREEYEV